LIDERKEKRIRHGGRSHQHGIMTKTIAERLLPEFDSEIATTRRVLDRIPEDKLSWKPHEKSMSLGRLAGHIAELPWLGQQVIELEKLTAGRGGSTPLVVSSRQQALQVLDERAEATRAAIAGASDEDLLQPWSLEFQGKTLFTLPRVGALRGFMLHHLIHHRGQFSVYLRLNDVAVPPIYGPSADESVV
jgi:uncharacterized damage-inducible protein DinB